MGLDMYLTGKKFFSHKAPRRDEDGFEIEEIIVKLGYWRKFADLHGFIVKTFRLDIDDINKIIAALKMEELPHTDGFFFRADYSPREMEALIEESLEAMGKALNFLALHHDNDKYWRSVCYRASW